MELKVFSFFMLECRGCTTVGVSVERYYPTNDCSTGDAMPTLERCSKGATGKGLAVDKGIGQVRTYCGGGVPPP